MLNYLGCGWAHGDGPTGIPDGAKPSKRSSGSNNADPDVATVSASDATSAGSKATPSFASSSIDLPPPPDLPTPPGASSSTSTFYLPDLLSTTLKQKSKVCCRCLMGILDFAVC